MIVLFTGLSFISPGKRIGTTYPSSVRIRRSRHTIDLPQKNTGFFNSPWPSTWKSAGDYDLVMIDCPPNLYQCSWNALLAADYVVVPVPPEDFGARGFGLFTRQLTTPPN